MNLVVNYFVAKSLMHYYHPIFPSILNSIISLFHYHAKLQVISISEFPQIISNYPMLVIIIIIIVFMFMVGVLF